MKLFVTPTHDRRHAAAHRQRAGEGARRAHCWQRILESGECGSITELAAAEKIDRSYLCRVLRLTLLAPEIVESIMDGVAENMIVQMLMKDSEARRGAQHVGAVD